MPACDEHNLKKSKDDEYLMMILVAHFGNNEVSRTQVATKVLRAWTRRPHIAQTIVNDPVPARLAGQETMAFRVNLDRFDLA